MDQRGFWSSYYARVFEEGRPWLDFSNVRVQAQTFALALEAAGPLYGAACLDVGCGWGQLARALVQFGAREVAATDIVTSTIERHTRDHPEIDWRCGNLVDPEFCSQLGTYDCVFLVEVLQYVPISETIAAAWKLLSPGGRIVGVVPNVDCPIVQNACRRFSGQYAPPTSSELAGVLASLVGAEHWALRGLQFGRDQRIVPYDVSPWTCGPISAGDTAPPNRLMFAAVMQAGTSR